MADERTSKTDEEILREHPKLEAAMEASLRDPSKWTRRPRRTTAV